jgi:catechol 2,3-dioxygenase-like lactoylglutathione lyase family enzyme
MKCKHIGLTLVSPKEIENFYQEILGMKLVKEFALNQGLANKIFNIPLDTQVFLLQSGDMFLEVFIAEKHGACAFDHICIEVPDRELLLSKADAGGYPITRIERDFSDLIFVKDKSGNVFEIKEGEKSAS